MLKKRKQLVVLYFNNTLVHFRQSTYFK